MQRSSACTEPVGYRCFYVKKVRKRFNTTLISAICLTLTVLALSTTVGVSPVAAQVANGLLGASENSPWQLRLTAQIGHAKRDCYTVAISGDGRLVLTGSKDADGTIVVWEAATGRELRRLRQSGKDAVLSLAITTDGRYAVAGGWDGTVTLWEVATGDVVRRFEGHSSAIHSVAVSANGQRVVTGGSNGTAILWDTATEKAIRRFQGMHPNIDDVALTPDGQYLVTGGGRPLAGGGTPFALQRLAPLEGLAVLWDAVTGEALQRFHVNSELTSVAVSADGRHVVTGYRDAARLWEAATGKLVHRFGGHSFAVLSVAITTDGHYIVTHDGTAPRLWDATTGSELRRFEGHDKQLLSVAITPDGRYLVAGGEEGAAVLWDMLTGEVLRRFKGYVSGIWSVAVTPDGRHLLMGDSDGHAHFWNLVSGRQIQRFTHEPTVWSAALTPDGRHAVTASWGERTVVLWDTVNGSELRRFTGHEDAVRSVAIASDGSYVATGSWDGTAILWDVETGKILQRFAGHDGTVMSVSLSNDGDYLVTGGVDGTARLWKVATGLEVQRFKDPDESQIRSVAIDSDSRYLLTGSWDEGLARVWDVAARAELRHFEGHGGEVVAVALAADARYAVTGSWDGTARLWNVATGAELQRFEGHGGEVVAVALTADGRYAVTGSLDGSTRLWDTDSGTELARLFAFGDGTWAIVSPDGRFDTNNLEEIEGLHWVIPDDPLRALPVEIFMRDYYEPRLLARRIAGERFPAVRSLLDLNRVQPKVTITSIHPQPGFADRVSVTVEASESTRMFKRQGKDVEIRTAVHDIRLFRDGQLVGYAPKSREWELNISDSQEADLPRWREASLIKTNPDTDKITLKFENIRLPHQKGNTKIEFSAYAFNDDKVKSTTARRTLTLPENSIQRKGRAYLITVGVNAYENPEWDLTYAANDALQISELLPDRLAQTGQFSKIVVVPLISDSRIEQGKRVLTKNDATKENIKAVLDLLSGRTIDDRVRNRIPNANQISPATPDDFVLIAFSGHGHADKSGNFYFFPHDIGKGHGQTVDRDLLRNTISSLELTSWTRDVDAGNIAMIVDACHAAATVEGAGFKPGPMGSRGLGQLSYDKGMQILTSTQADDVALESRLIQQGLLSYALVQDGVKAEQADFKPKDELVYLTEWLQYGVKRVPELYTEIRGGQLKAFRRGKDGRGLKLMASDAGRSLKIQQPSLFDFKRRKREFVLLRTTN